MVAVILLKNPLSKNNKKTCFRNTDKKTNRNYLRVIDIDVGFILSVSQRTEKIITYRSSD